MVAAVLGMIPEGLYLLTTVALALSTMRLSKRKVLLHDMKSIETLARVDVLCVDKTGTITEPEMKVKEVVFEEEDVTERLTDYVLASKDNNATMQALQSFVPENAEQKHAALKVVPFTSSTKYGGIIFDDATYLLGAPEFIMRSEFEKSKIRFCRIRIRGTVRFCLRSMTALSLNMAFQAALSRWPM